MRYDEALAALVPQSSPIPIHAAGAANGRNGLAAALADGHAAGLAAAGGHTVAPAVSAPRAAIVETGAALPLWSVPPRNRA